MSVWWLVAAVYAASGFVTLAAIRWAPVREDYR